MDNMIFEKVISKEYLLVITDKENNILFKTDASPVSQFYKAYYKKEVNLEGKEIFVYANQVGIALATLSELETVVGYIGHQVSQPAKEFIEKKGIELKYNEEIDLVKSSKDASMVCPIEEGLYNTNTLLDKFNFLEEKFK